MKGGLFCWLLSVFPCYLLFHGYNIYLGDLLSRTTAGVTDVRQQFGKLALDQ